MVIFAAAARLQQFVGVDNFPILTNRLFDICISLVLRHMWIVDRCHRIAFIVIGLLIFRWHSVAILLMIVICGHLPFGFTTCITAAVHRICGPCRCWRCWCCCGRRCCCCYRHYCWMSVIGCGGEKIVLPMHHQLIIIRTMEWLLLLLLMIIVKASISIIHIVITAVIVRWHCQLLMTIQRIVTA